MQVKSIILAAGKGTRLKSEDAGLPKCLRSALGRPLLDYVLDAAGFIAREATIIVVGYMREKVIARYPELSFAAQDEQLGTGHAVQCAMPMLENYEGDVLILCGDTPLVERATLENLIDFHRESGNAGTVLSCRIERDIAIGRILREPDGSFARIVEAKDASEGERAVREYNAGVYVFDRKTLASALAGLKNNNANGEYYLTDVPALIKQSGEKIGVFSTDNENEILGVNTQEDLTAVEEILSKK